MSAQPSTVPAEVTSVAAQAAPLEQDAIIELWDASWADYERMVEIRGESSSPRISYSEGRLELTSPSKHHERIGTALGALVMVWAVERGVPLTAYGRWTLEEKAVEKGLEPDECFVLGDVEDPVSPDIAIEVNWTKRGTKKREIYRALGVREVWFWQQDEITLFELRDGEYVEIERSALLPELDLAQLLSFVHVKPGTKAIAEYRAALGVGR